MSKHKYLLILLLATCLVGLGCFCVALAQETAPPATDAPIIDAEMQEEETLPPIGEMGPPPEEVMQDMNITFEDLGASEATIKPDSIFHPFKRLGRNFTEMITFDPVKDAELKLQHANQELSEMKQLVDEQGMENIDPDDLINSVNWFENKIEKIQDASERLKNEKTDQPAEIESFLDEFTDKQFKEHKVLEIFHQEITEHKDVIDDAEDVFAEIKDKQNEVLKDFGETLTIVDDPEKIPERLANIADAQEGSAFKLIKTTEILEQLEEQMPDTAKEAIEQAQEKTFEKLQENMSELPAIVRAEKFKEYTNALPGDETVQLGIFEKIKQLPDIPQDILEKIEEVKEFAVKRFEDKIEKFEKPEIKDKFFENLQGNDLDDIMALEELKAKITAKQEALRNRIEQEHTQGVDAFKKQFTDVKSQDQAERFERLVKEMTSNPNPKTLKMIKELEEEVAQNPEKRAFIEDIKNKTKAEFENKFRQEGDRFFDRMATFNPEDMMVFREFEQEKFFDPRMMNQFYNHQTDMYKEHIQGIENPEMFNRFDERMRFAPPEVIDMIQTRDHEFGDVMQFKARKMMEMEMELKEREMRLSMERAWRDSEDDFQLQLRQTRSDAEKEQLYEQKRERDFSLMETEFENRKIMMETRFENDPFCDAMCQEFQKIHMEQDLQHRTWELKEDARMREFQLEMDMKDHMQHDPFAGQCYDPRSCMEHCNNNPGAPGCGMHMPMEPMMPGPMGPMSPGMPMGPSPCPPGEISMPAGPGNWICKYDPYYKSPEFFKDCPPGEFWNEAKGFCEFDQSSFQPMPMPGMPGPAGPDYPMPPMPSVNFCGPGEYWDNMRGCVRDDFKQCPNGEFFDFFENRCVKEWKSCPPGEYWDPGRNSCIRDVIGGPVEQCPDGEFFDFYKRQCIREIHCPMIMPMPCQPGEIPTHDECGPSCIASTPNQCYNGERWDDMKQKCVGDNMCPTHWNPVCGNDNITHSNECFAKQSGVGIKHYGECGGGMCGSSTCGPGQECMDHNRGLCCERGQIACPDGRCAWTMTECSGYIPPTACPAGQVSCPDDSCAYSWEQCGTSGGYCGDRICQHDEYCPMDCETTTPGPPVGHCPDGQISCPDDSCAYSMEQCYSSVCGDGQCDHDETAMSCSDCMTTGGGCGSYTDSASCNANPECAVWCEGESSPNSCFSPGHVCGTTGDTSCNTMGGTCCNACANNSYISGTECNCCGTCSSDTICPSNIYTTSAGACDYQYCPNGCTFGSNGCPDMCISESTGTCGDGTCNVNETPASCSSDCGGATITCPSNIYTTDSGACDYQYCPNGCTFGSNGCPDMCAYDNNAATCPSTAYNDYTTGYTCSYSACPNGCNFDSAGCPTSCYDSATTGYCGDGVCDHDETAMSCSDCMTTGGGCGSYTDSASCNANPECAVWCEGESSPNSCFSPGHVCSTGDTNTTIDCYTFYDNSTCSNAGCTWCSGSNTCNELGFACPVVSCSSQYDPGSCTSNGCTWCDSDNTCIESNYTCTVSCPTCDYGMCPDGCEMDYDGCWTSGTCMPVMTGCDCSCGWSDTCDCVSMCPDAGGDMMFICGDGICDSGEYCPEDCDNMPPASIFGGIKRFFQRVFGF